MSNLLPSRSLCGVVTWIVWGMIAQTVSAQQSPSESAGVLLQGYCFDCHSEQHAEAGVDLEEMLRESSFAIKFRDWRKVMKQLDTGEMPPASAEQLSPSQRRELTSFVRHELRSVAEKHAGDPGPSIIRRLTSAEYAHTIHDLTGLNIGLTNGTVSDAVGGEGFTNAGVAQFVQDSTLELYLETANHIAEHAVIGTGPIRFYQDPGQTGLELSAINRIQDIYRRHGFRQAAGEGAIAYGLERYPQAFYAMWRFLLSWSTGA
ncbi:MAG: DUF1587 domain-containing protein [Planctomycetaceae bacterium]